MSEQQLERGRRWLGNRLYAPEAMGRRIVTFLEKLGPRKHLLEPGFGAPSRRIDSDARSMVGTISRLGPDESRMMRTVSAAIRERPDAAGFVIDSLLQYLQVRHMYQSQGFWDPRLAAMASPWEALSA
jgi:hypothetical protein